MRLLRIGKIIFIIIRFRLDRMIDRGKLPLWARILLSPLVILPKPKDSPATSLRKAFERLGPIFIKFGQILSTRRDLFETETSDELQKLQDQVPPFDGQKAREIIEKSLDAPIESYFTNFEKTALASASLAQVHCAKFKDGPHTGKEIVIKIIRPGIEKVIKQDLEVMHMMAAILLFLWQDAKRLHPDQIIKDYERTILDELNLQLEASNTLRLRKNWVSTDDNINIRAGKLYVPEVYLDYCRQDIMVMERIYGLGSADIASMHAQQVNMKKLAHLGVEIFFTQVFEDNFFHADMHPGNVFIDTRDPENPSYIALDSAIIGSLTEADKTYLARNLLAFFLQDYFEVARLHVESGWVPGDTDVKEFETVIRSVCEPIFQKPIKDISFGRVLLSLFQTARRFNMEVQPQLVLLQKTLLNIEGMGRQLYPDLDLWETAAPYMETWMKQRMGIGGIFKRIGKNAPVWLEQLPEIPQLALDAIQELKTMGRHNREQSHILKSLTLELEQQRQQARNTKRGSLALSLALIIALALPMTGLANQTEALVGASLLGSLGLYWLFFH